MTKNELEDIVLVLESSKYPGKSAVKWKTKHGEYVVLFSDKESAARYYHELLAGRKAAKRDEDGYSLEDIYNIATDLQNLLAFMDKDEFNLLTRRAAREGYDIISSRADMVGLLEKIEESAIGLCEE